MIDQADISVLKTAERKWGNKKVGKGISTSNKGTASLHTDGV